MEFEADKVLPDLVLTDGPRVASCSASMAARHGPPHHFVSDKVAFNYTSVREIRPGRLLYIHDGAARYIDVARAK